MHIAVVGAGPAGTWTSILLARRGYTVSLVDPQVPWEKPCGGGVTAKALSSFGIFESDLPRNNIDRITIYFGDTNSVSVAPQKPIAILSPRELGRSVLQEAAHAELSVVRRRSSQLEPLAP